ncbi:hypothetical protein [Bacillus sp. 1P06AnD]|uniref:hypothetical protein n=1 Tax=Bacillus sp. 1P06AnD TaxID=3132208 RepID=UPI00399F5B98
MAYNKGMINAFINIMHNQDIVMIAQGDYVYFGQVGPYSYVEQFDNNEDGMCHQRYIHWLVKVERHTLNDKVQEHLRNRLQLQSFSILYN